MATIQLQLCALHDIVTANPHLERKQQIIQRKNAIYAYRNVLLSQQLGHAIQMQDFAKTEFGKPYLAHFPNFYFNHSHSAKLYVLASSQKIRDVGVDVEDLDRQVKFLALAKHAFHAEELQRWLDLGQDSDYWFKVWTTKEAVLKASGLGIRLNLNELNTQTHPEQDGGMCSHPQLGTFAYQNFNIAHAMLTVAWRSEYSCKGFHFPLIQIQHV